MTKLTRMTLTAILAIAPVALFAQPTGTDNKLSGARPTAATTPASTPAPPKVGDHIQDNIKGRPTPAAPAHHGADVALEQTARVIEYAKKDKTEVTRAFVFHKDADGKLIIKEYDKLDGKEVTSNPEGLEWALQTIGVVKEGKEGDVAVVGPDKKNYHVRKGWHSFDSSAVKKEPAGPNGEKLLDTDHYVKGANGWAKVGAKPKVKTAKPKTGDTKAK